LGNEQEMNEVKKVLVSVFSDVFQPKEVEI